MRPAAAPSRPSSRACRTRSSSGPSARRPWASSGTWASWRPGASAASGCRRWRGRSPRPWAGSCRPRAGARRARRRSRLPPTSAAASGSSRPWGSSGGVTSWAWSATSGSRRAAARPGAAAPCRRSRATPRRACGRRASGSCPKSWSRPGPWSAASSAASSARARPRSPSSASGRCSRSSGGGRSRSRPWPASTTAAASWRRWSAC
mmetsp:Transcript_91544/g.296152  ORF Transcript_91544/g.296152 Transcript_91544/m.296152 type:complete len:206 (-) Transcript_91544:399-1016(-)